MTAEKLRKVRGGVIGCFTPKETVIDIAEDATLGAVGDNGLGIKVPAGKFVYGAYVKNVADDLASGGAATLGVKVGSDAIVASTTALAIVKGAGAAALAADPVFVAEDSEVMLTVATAALTAGKLTVGVIYG